jgi:predicted nucleic acid-binding protein
VKLVVVDTNVLFAALRSTNSKLREVLLDKDDVTLYAPNFLVGEIFRHKDKILQKSQLTPEEVYEVLNQLLQGIHFVSEQAISTANLVAAYRLCKDIDPKDFLFVALTLEIDGELWTRDEELKRGLERKGFLLFF